MELEEEGFSKGDGSIVFKIFASLAQPKELLQENSPNSGVGIPFSQYFFSSKGKVCQNF